MTTTTTMTTEDRELLQIVKRELQIRYRENVEYLKTKIDLTENEKVLLNQERKLLRRNLGQLQKIAA